MKFKTFLESYYATIKVGSVPVEIFKNPSRYEFFQIDTYIDWQEVKCFLDKKNLYAFSGSIYHRDVKDQQLELSTMVPCSIEFDKEKNMYFIRNSGALRAINYTADMINIIKNHPQLKYLLGNFTIDFYK